MKPLLAETLMSDPRVAEARRLLHEAVRDQQSHITAVRPADPARKIGYDDLIRSFNQMRGGDLFYPYLGSGIGRGPLVELADGSVKYDLISGIGVHYLGHSAPLFLDASIDAALRDVVMQGNLQQNVQTPALSRTLLDAAAGTGSALRHCFLSSSGAMANENALKLIFHKRHPASRLLAFEHCFAGRTLALSQVTDSPAYRIGLPQTLAVDYVPFFDATRPAESTAHAVHVLKSHLLRYPKRHGAMWFELVQGEGGYHAGDPAFFAALMDVLKANDVAVVIDEIQTFGRMPQLFAFQHFGLEKYVDVVTVGKLLQVCATLFSEAYRPGPGLISQTFTASTSAILAGQAMLNELLHNGYFGPTGRVAAVHARFVHHLQQIAQRHAGWIAGPYGLGGMIACTPFDGSPDKAKKLLHTLFELGVIAFYAGHGPTRVRFLPPVGAIANEEIDTVCQILEAALARVASPS